MTWKCAPKDNGEGRNPAGAVREDETKQQMPYTSLKQTVRMKEFTVVLFTSSSKDREGVKALVLHQVLQKGDLRLHSRMTASHTQLAQCKV